MSTSTTKTTIEVCKQRSPNFVLSLFAACASTFASVGEEGANTLSKQLEELLGDRRMAFSELQVRYSCRFGFSVNDALDFIGFTGNFKDFINSRTCFVANSGCIRVAPVGKVDVVGSPAFEPDQNHEKLASKPLLETAIDTASTTDPDGSQRECESDAESLGTKVVFRNPWRLVGSRLAAAFVDDEDDVCNIHEDSPDPKGWNDVGCRIATACKQQDQGDFSYDADVGETDDGEDDVNPAAWSTVGYRVAEALSKVVQEEDRAALLSDENDDGHIIDLEAWQDVGSRFAAAFKRAQAEDSAGYITDGVDAGDSVDLAAWQDVGGRFAAAIARVKAEDDAQDE